MVKEMRVHSIRQRLLLLTILCVVLSMQTATAENNVSPDERLTGKIDYWFVGHLQQTDDAGRVLVWEATIEGDLEGRMKWWFISPPPVSPVAHTGGQTSFYAARWEIWIDDELALAGESAGKTVFADGADGIWDGHGRVTQVAGRFKGLNGRKVYETGPVLLGEDPPKTFSGTGMFLIY